MKYQNNQYNKHNLQLWLNYLMSQLNRVACMTSIGPNNIGHS